MPKAPAAAVVARMLRRVTDKNAADIISLRQAVSGSLRQLDERLAFLDDIRGELGSVDGVDILCRVDRSIRNEQDVAGLERHRRLALDFIYERAFEDIDDLFARVLMPGRHLSWSDVDAYLDGLAPGDAKIVPLEVGAFRPRL